MEVGTFLGQGVRMGVKTQLFRGLGYCPEKCGVVWDETTRGPIPTKRYGLGSQWGIPKVWDIGGIYQYIPHHPTGGMGF